MDAVIFLILQNLIHHLREVEFVYLAIMIQQFAQKSAPFLVHLSYTAPHYPLHAKSEDIAKYRGRYRQGWQKLRNQRHQKLVHMGLINPSWKMVVRDPKAYE